MTEETSSQPHTIDQNIDELPRHLAPLKMKDNWVLWKWETVNGNLTKVPYQPNGRKAKTSDSTTWSSHAEVTDAVENFSGIGFCLDDDIAAFDVDNCRDLATGNLHPWATELIERANSYTEVTISGTGIRIIGNEATGTKIHKKQRVDETVTCETYRKPKGRYIVITGAQIGDRPIANIDAIQDQIVAELRAREEGNGHDTGQTGAGVYEDELARTIADGGRDRHGNSRSENVWWVIMEAMRRGWALDKIRKTLKDRTNSISEHVLDQNNPDRSIERYIVRALTEISFSTDRTGKKFPTMANICVAVAKMGISLRYDEFADRIAIKHSLLIGEEVKEHPLEDSDELFFRTAIDREWQLKISKEKIHDAFVEIAKVNKYHPVINYHDSVSPAHDGTERVGTWLITYMGAEDTEYTRAVGKILVVAAVKRIREPGCKFDEIVVLESAQGLNKSTALAILAVNPDWFTDSFPLGAPDKEVIEATRGKWIIEISELAGLRRAEVEHVKSQASRQVDRARMAYDRNTIDRPRQFIFTATTNSSVYLGDQTGNRRFLPVKAPADGKSIDLDGLLRDRDQLWAEAVKLYHAGESIVLPRRLWPTATEIQQERTIIDPYLSILREKLIDGHNVEFDNIKVFARSLLQLVGVADENATMQHFTRISETMRRLGWRKVTVSHKNRKDNGYTKGNGPFTMLLVDPQSRKAYLDGDQSPV